MKKVNILFPNNTTIDISAQDDEWDKESQLKHIQVYLKNGIEVREGDVVFDVGANIGLFSCMIFDKCNGNVKIFAFEALAETYKELQGVCGQIDNGNLKAFHIGISKEEGINEFMFYPNAPGLSTQYYDVLSESLDDMVENLDENIDIMPEFFGNKEQEIRGVNEGRFNKLRAIYSLKKVFDGRLVKEKVIPLGKFIKEKKIERIDLLKIDVNGSELDVCQGVGEDNWKIIKQVVIEVPVKENRLTKIEEVLKKNGFTDIIIEYQEAVINEGLIYALVYAKR